MKKSNWIYIIMLLLGFLLGYKGFIKYYPNLLYRGAKKKINRTDNTFGFAKLPNAESKFVVKPNPDFLYSTCFYNLEDGPLHLEGDLPDSSYWSIAFYEPNTVNFYVKNDQQFHSNKLDILIASEGDELPKNAEDFEIVQSPSKKGLILFRLLITDTSPENLAKFEAIQQSVQVKPFQ